MLKHSARKERKAKNKEIRVKYFYARGNDFPQTNKEFPLEFTNKIVCTNSEEFLKKIARQLCRFNLYISAL